jgi:hypothetical protein
MNMKPEQDSKSEENLFRLIASSLYQLIDSRFSLNTISNQLAQEIAATAKIDPEGRAYAPDQFTFSMHPDNSSTFNSTITDEQTLISNKLQNAIEQAGYRFARKPHATLATDPTLAPWDLRVIAWHSSNPLQFSSTIKPEVLVNPEKPPPGAFLIIKGKRHFPLTKETISIGRHLDNDLILKDQHVSRLHSSIKLQKSNYQIIDCDSTAGTRVNGRLIKSHTLIPGDVISIAGIQIIYGEDAAGPPDSTAPYLPPIQPGKDRNVITPRKLYPHSPKRTTPYRKDRNSQD